MKRSWFIPVVALIATATCTDRPDAPGAGLVAPAAPSQSAAASAVAPAFTGPSTVCSAFQEELTRAEAALGAAPGDAALTAEVADLVAITQDVCG